MAHHFAQAIVQEGFMVITGGADGIMRAAQEGAGRENSFGVNIMLPFEQGPNSTIADDEKLITFKYFFTRKLMFQKEANAIALFPGGFGTHDEGFEILTLAQTGKSDPQPIIAYRLLVATTGMTGRHSWYDSC
ncbi:MAG: LOG family protein [Nitrospira sp.]|nr:LOG family protein [Nitrospira sp.]